MIDWEIITSKQTSLSQLRVYLGSTDFSGVSDCAKLQTLVAQFQRVLAASRPGLFPCQKCGKSFDTQEHLVQHEARRHQPGPGDSAASLASLIAETRDFLAREIRAAVRAALEAQAALPVGVSFAGDLQISGFSVSPDASN